MDARVAEYQPRVMLTIYAPEGTSMHHAATVKRVHTHFESWPESQVAARLGKRNTPCVLVVITDRESEAYTTES